jgi:hypothetical protein
MPCSVFPVKLILRARRAVCPCLGFELQAVVDRVEVALNQAIQQHRGDTDEQPAFERAGNGNLVGVTQHPDQYLVRQQDPQGGKQGVSQNQAQRGGVVDADGGHSHLFPRSAGPF